MSDRGSRFLLCLRSRTDPDYPRYPRLPVRRCAGFEPAGGPAAEPGASGRGAQGSGGAEAAR